MAYIIHDECKSKQEFYYTPVSAAVSGSISAGARGAFEAKASNTGVTGRANPIAFNVFAEGTIGSTRVALPTCISGIEYLSGQSKWAVSGYVGNPYGSAASNVTISGYINLIGDVSE